MIYCQNCGHDSHCGVPLMKEFDGNWQNTVMNESKQIEVCKHCRCTLCTESEIKGKLCL